MKPKRHLLLEPDKAYYEPFIKPLLEQSESTYCYSSSQEKNFHEQVRAVFRNGTLVPPRPPLEPEDPRRRELDPSLLVIANLASTTGYQHSTLTNLNYAKMVLHGIGFGALGNGDFQNAGLIRTLCWIPEASKPTVISYEPSSRFALSAGLALGATVSEVVGVCPHTDLITSRARQTAATFRSSFLWKLDAETVNQRMTDAGIVLPEGREFIDNTQHLGQEAEDSETISPFVPRSRSIDALKTKIDAVSTRIASLAPFASKLMNRKTDVADTPWHGPLASIDYPQCRAAAYKHMGGQSLRSEGGAARASVAMDLSLQIINLEISLKDLQDQGKDLDSLRDLEKSIVGLNQMLERDVRDQFPPRHIPVWRSLVDEQFMMCTASPVLSWDQRQYEPLKAKSTDFFPACDLALLDLVPKPTELGVPGLASNSEAASFCVDLVRTLFGSRAASLPVALDRLGINAAKDLIPMVPAITDPRRGGRTNPHDLRVRMLTEEMIVGLVKAFFEWPFRPQTWELENATGGGGGDAAGEEVTSDQDAAVATDLQEEN